MTITYSTPSPVYPQITEQQLSQIKEDQRRQKEALLSLSKDVLISKNEQVKATAVLLDIANNELNQDLDVAKIESEQYKADYFCRVEKDQQNEEKKKKCKSTDQKKRTKNLKDYVRGYLDEWEVNKSSDHLLLNVLMNFR